jgi:hypothetical protein
MNTLLLERYRLVLSKRGALIYVNLDKQGNYKNAKIAVKNYLGNTIVTNVLDNMYPLVMRIYQTVEKSKVYRNGKLIAICYEVKN